MTKQGAGRLPGRPYDAGMPDLHGRRILVAEDEAIIALEIEATLEDAHAQVLGPHAGLEALLNAIEGPAPDAAILDVHLGADEVFPAAEALMRRGVPVIFHSGQYDRNTLLSLYPQAHSCPKPGSHGELVRLVHRVTH